MIDNIVQNDRTLRMGETQYATKELLSTNCDDDVIRVNSTYIDITRWNTQKPD